MKLLYAVPYAPTPIRTRPYNLLRQLAQRGHDVTLATVWTGEQERAALKEWSGMGVRVLAAPLSRQRSIWNCATRLLSAIPLQAVYSWQPSLARQISRLHERAPFDLAHFEHLRGAQYGLDMQSRGTERRLSPPIVWDSVDCISLLFRHAAALSRSPMSRAVARFETPRTKRYEPWLVRQFDRTLVVTDRERLALEELLGEPSNDQSKPSPRVITVRNGVDLSYFSPVTADRAPKTIIMTGKMSYHANVTAAVYLLQEIMPLVWHEMPDVCVQIVGQNPPRHLTQMARRYPGRVQVTGSVTDLRPYMARASIAVAPIVYSAGIQNKLLEAMAMELPVVATPNALAALSAEPERDALVGQDAKAFARQIQRLMQDDGLRHEIAANGRRYVELNHDWRQVALELEIVYDGLIQARHPHA